MPRFSWATLSVAYHPSNSTGHYTPEQLRTLAARFAMVTLEKWTGVDAYVPSATLAAPSYESPGGLYGCQRGSNLSRCGCCAEDAIKRIDPSVMTVAYLNSASIPRSRTHGTAPRETWRRTQSGGCVTCATRGPPAARGRRTT